MALTLDGASIKDFKRSRVSFLAAAMIGVVLSTGFLLFKGEDMSKMFAILCGTVLMMGSTCGVLVTGLAPYAEWITATGISGMVGSCAVAGLWLPSIYAGIILANWLSIMPGLAVCILNVTVYTTVAGADFEQQFFLIAMGVSFVMNKLNMEETKSEARNLEQENRRGHEGNMESVAEMEESVKSIRRVNQVLLETLRPLPGGVGSGAVEELMERLDFLQGTMPGIDQELQPCKALLREFLKEGEMLKTPPVKGKKSENKPDSKSKKKDKQVLKAVKEEKAEKSDSPDKTEKEETNKSS